MPDIKIKYHSSNYVLIEGLPLVCKLCGCSCKSKSGLGSHIKNQHAPLSYREYLLQFFNIDLLKLKKEWEDSSQNRKKEGHKKTAQANKKSLSEEKKNKIRSTLKGRYSLDWFISEYGELEGLKKYNERNRKIAETCYFTTQKYLDSRNRNPQIWSRQSQLLFWAIVGKLNRKEGIFFGEMNHEYSCHLPLSFDFVDTKTNKVIEYNGDKWHANPKKYKADDIPLPFTGKKASEIWELDTQKIALAKTKGYKVLVIWESEYKKFPEKTLQKCIDFLQETS